MSRRANPALIGAFVLGAVAIAIATIVVLASGSFFQTRDRFVMYFDEAVTGLSIGAPVVFEGVNVGKVVDVRIVIDSSREEAIAIPVVVEISSNRVEVQGESQGVVQGVRRQIERGLRARLAMQSLVTGELYVSLDLAPEKTAVYKGPPDSQPPEIPTIPSELAEVRQTFRSLADRIGGLPLEELVGKLASAANGLDVLLKKPELQHAMSELDATLTEAHRVVAHVDRRVDPLADEAQAAVAAAHEALVRVQGAVANVDQMVEPGSPVQVQLLTALQQLERAARSVQALANALAAQPDSIVFGKGSDGQ
ncbi:MAG TPA: MlaD family protein [Myxococcota bacterium]|nr:MlaD family protein [Myxococcota bacterium]